MNKTNGEARFSFQFVPPQHSTDKSSSESSESEEDIVQPRTRGGRRSVMQITSDNEEETQFNFNRTESATGPDEQLSNNNITEYTDDIFDQVIEVTEIPNLSAQDSEVHDDNGTNPDNNHIEAFLENEIRMIDLVYETLLT